jgi:zinc/manganese transport system substrate-binding protein
MRHLFCAVTLLAGLILLLAAPAPALAGMNVFACEPEWASLAEEVGGDLVDTFAATNASQDPHYIRARPSLIAKMRKADLVICSGASLEIGWLPVLFQKAGNARAQPGGAGYLMAAEVVPVLEKPDAIDRSMGDVHPEGNPHVHLNPHNILLVAGELTNRLKTLDPSHADHYQTRYEKFAANWQQSISRWEASAANLKGKGIITHHSAWSYLIDWLGLDLVNTLEPKPGIPASTGHLESLLQQVRETPVLAIVRSPYAPDKASEWLSAKSGIPAVVLPYTIGGEAGVTDLFDLFDRSINHLTEISDGKR